MSGKQKAVSLHSIAFAISKEPQEGQMQVGTQYFPDQANQTRSEN